MSTFFVFSLKEPSIIANYKKISLLQQISISIYKRLISLA